MADERNYFLWFSDIHYDPYYSTAQAYSNPFDPAVCNDASSIPSIGKHGCDSPEALVRAAFDRAVGITAQEGSSPTFIVITGDSIRHGVDELFGETEASNVDDSATSEGMKAAGLIIRELASIVQEYFPKAEIIFSIGNNDVVPDYHLDLMGDTHSILDVKSAGMLGVIYQALSIDDGTKNTQATGNGGMGRAYLKSSDKFTFLRGGYYYRTFHNGSLIVLSLNTVLYSGFLQPAPSNRDDPGGQFTWLKIMLAEARQNGAQVIVVGHIPPTIGSFRHTQVWKDEYIETYYNIINQFDGVVKAQLFGHLHTDEFRVIGMEGSSENFTMMGTPLLITPSITPLHGNDPSFRLMRYGRGSGVSKSENTANGDGYRMLDYESHRCSIDSGNNWMKLYTFSETYSVKSNLIQNEGLSSSVFRDIVQSIQDGNEGSESTLFKSFRNFLRSGADGNSLQTGANIDCNAQCQDEWICTFTSATRRGYDTCLLDRQNSQNSYYSANGKSIIGIVGAVLFVTAFIFVAVVRFVKLKKRQHYESTPSVQGEETNGSAKVTAGGEAVPQKPLSLNDDDDDDV